MEIRQKEKKLKLVNVFSLSSLKIKYIMNVLRVNLVTGVLQQ